jgi:hypothetical protein
LTDILAIIFVFSALIFTSESSCGFHQYTILFTLASNCATTPFDECAFSEGMLLMVEYENVDH